MLCGSLEIVLRIGVFGIQPLIMPMAVSANSHCPKDLFFSYFMGWNEKDISDLCVNKICSCLSGVSNFNRLRKMRLSHPVGCLITKQCCNDSCHSLNLFIFIQIITDIIYVKLKPIKNHCKNFPTSIFLIRIL